MLSPGFNKVLHLIIIHNFFVDPLELKHHILEAVHWYDPHHHTYRHLMCKLFRIQTDPECTQVLETRAAKRILIRIQIRSIY
jgi:hypothetical protein